MLNPPFNKAHFLPKPHFLTQTKQTIFYISTILNFSSSKIVDYSNALQLFPPFYLRIARFCPFCKFRIYFINALILLLRSKFKIEASKRAST